MSNESVLVNYYAKMDAGDAEGALALIDPAATFSITIFGNTTEGNGRGAFADYIAGRGSVSRRHEPARVQIGDDIEFVAGAVVNEDDSVPGYFLGAATVKNGLITRYKVIMDQDYQLAPRPKDDV